MLDLSVIYKVKIFSIGDTKAGTKMGKLQLINTSDESILNCILWEEALGRIDSKVFRSNNLVRVLAGTFNEKYNNALVTSLELVEEAKLGHEEDKREELFAGIVAYANKIKDEKLKTFVVELLYEHADEFKIMPAAKLMHHNYIGGLLQHTLECLQISDKVLEMFPKKINSDDLYAGCILHDFGKIFEYTIDVETGLIDYNLDFKKEWVTHSQWGFTNCMAHDFKTVAKMIACHHGRLDWGAVVDLSEKDLEPEMYLLHHVDDLSAKYGKISVSDI